MPLVEPPAKPLWRRALQAGWTVVGGVGVLGGWWAFDGDDRFNAPWQEANAFFRAIGPRGVDAAYARTAPAFRAEVSRDVFAATVAAARLDRVKGGGWNDRDFGFTRATMRGRLSLSDGGKTPATITLTRAGLLWKVRSFQVADAPAVGAGAPAPLPRRPPEIDAATGVPIAHPPILP